MTDPQPSKARDEAWQGKWAAVIGALVIVGLGYWAVATLTQTSLSDRGSGPATMTTPGPEGRPSSFPNPHATTKPHSGGGPSAATTSTGTGGAEK